MDQKRIEKIMASLDGISIETEGNLGPVEEVFESSLSDLFRKMNVKLVDCDSGKELILQTADKPAKQKQTGTSKARLVTGDVIASLMSQKRNKRAKESTIKTYEKHFALFNKRFPLLPEGPEAVIEYLAQFDGASGRHRRNHQDLIAMLYDHAV